MKQFLFSLQKSEHAHQELLLPASAEVGCAKFICFLARRPFVGVHRVVALGLLRTASPFINKGKKVIVVFLTLLRFSVSPPVTWVRGKIK